MIAEIAKLSVVAEKKSRETKGKLLKVFEAA